MNVYFLTLNQPSPWCCVMHITSTFAHHKKTVSVVFKLSSGQENEDFTRNVDFKHWTFKCDLDLGVATQLLCFTHSLIKMIICAKLYQIFFQRFKSYGANTKYRLFNTWSLRVTLTLGVAIQLLCSAHILIIVIICTKLLKKVRGVKKLWSGHQSVTDGLMYGRTDGGHFLFSSLRKGIQN
jgi:hypothetical protein